MPRWIRSVLVILGTLALLPFACIWRARNAITTEPRIHIVQGMDNQARYRTQQTNPLFADTRASRAPVAGTVARGTLIEDPAVEKGYSGETWSARIPVPVTPALLARGRQRYEIYCSPCHGLSGYGDGVVARRADRLQEGTWVPPLSFHGDQVVSRPDGHLFNTITNGIRTMPAYGSMVSVQDRWAIVAYVRALQRSQHATIADVPPVERERLLGSAP